MSPTIVLRDRRPLLALGSPGGSTIITTVLQILVNRLDRGLTLAEAIAAPRVAPSNRTPVSAEQAWIDLYGAALTSMGHSFAAVGQPGTSAAEIGAATAIEFGPRRQLTAAAEPTRRGGGAAAVVHRR
jgi:gamma-glutamyltranspeptidase/glutathione hydrolase